MKNTLKIIIAVQICCGYAYFGNPQHKIISFNDTVINFWKKMKKLFKIS